MKKSLLSLFFSIAVLTSFANEIDPPFYAADFPASAKGAIMMDYTSVFVPSQDKTYYECLVWDKYTGKSILYYFNYTDGKFVAYAEEAQIPTSISAVSSSSEKSGVIMMDYTSVHVPSDDKTFYECLIWNTKTGKSVLYYYNYTDSKFKAYSDDVQLPNDPLNGLADGEFMMDYTSVHVPTQEKTYYEIMVWDTQSGYSQLYFFDYNLSKFVTYEEKVQLPSEPMD